MRSYLEKAEIIDPSNGTSWTPYADQISSKILATKGQDDYIAFWESLLEFFVDYLEPKWNHLHKGHIFFRLGVAALAEDVKYAKTCLEKALEEDRVLEKKLGVGDAEIEKKVRKYSSYVILCIMDHIVDTDFESKEERQKFFKEFVSPSFDSAIRECGVEPEKVQYAINYLVPRQALEQTHDTRQELDKVYAQRLPIAIISLAGAFLENILLGILYYEREVKFFEVLTKEGKTEKVDIRKATLNRLFKEATNKEIFPSESIEAACKMIQIFRNRFHPGNEMRQDCHENV